MPDSLIVLKNLSKRFGKKKAVNRISISIRVGEIFGFLGANGAGKTTTIRMLCGLTKPTAGLGTIGDLNIWKDRFRIRSRFGYETRPDSKSIFPDIQIPECTEAGRWLGQPAKHANRRCFTCTVSTQKAEDFADPDRNRNS